MSIKDDIAALDAGALVELFEMDVTTLGGSVERFHAGTNDLQNAVVWQGNSYQPWPVQAQGFAFTGQGALPRPTLTVANVTGLISSLALNFDDLLGVKVSRKRTFAKYLDAVNFPGGVNPSANPDNYLPDDVWIIQQKTAETKATVVFELSSSFDLPGVQLPGRQIVPNTCMWQYKSAECSWAPNPTLGPFYDVNDAPTTAANDQCSKKLSGCQARFGQYSPLPYGGFPSSTIPTTP